jgi:heme exporter protein D
VIVSMLYADVRSLAMYVWLRYALGVTLLAVTIHYTHTVVAATDLQATLCSRRCLSRTSWR